MHTIYEILDHRGLYQNHVWKLHPGQVITTIHLTRVSRHLHCHSDYLATLGMRRYVVAQVGEVLLIESRTTESKTGLVMVS